MNKTTLSFNASEQLLTSAECPKKVASNTVSYIEAVFELGANWSGFDSVRAVWSTRLEKISTVLDSNGKCIVPHELLANTQKVSVNLVGSIVEDDVLTDRLTTYPIVALDVDADALVEGTETTEVTPSQFEQFVEQVIAEVEKVTGMTATAVALPSGSAPTATYEDGVLTLGIPRGEKGDTGDTGPQGEKGDKGDTGAKGDTGEQGETGNGIVTVAKTSTSGLVDTYTITFTDGTTTTFEVTNGQDGEVTYDELSELLPTETASGDIASFNDGQAVIPAVSCVADIDPIQDLHGYDAPWVAGGGINKANIADVSGSKTNTYYVDITSEYVLTAGTTYTLSCDVTSTIQPFSISAGVGDSIAYRADIYTTNNHNNGHLSITFTPTSQQLATYNKLAIRVPRYGQASAFTFSISNIQLEIGSTAHSYAPYENICPISGHDDVTVTVADDVDNPTVSEDYTTTLPSTTYGGTLDLVSGVLTVTDGYIASYNGETLPSTWISDRDVYASGTTPTIGAQVVYKLATPQTYQLTPQQIDTLKGQNNITATSGQVSVTYKADIQKYIDNAIATFA